MPRLLGYDELPPDSGIRYQSTAGSAVIRVGRPSWVRAALEVVCLWLLVCGSTLGLNILEWRGVIRHDPNAVSPLRVRLIITSLSAALLAVLGAAFVVGSFRSRLKIVASRHGLTVFQRFLRHRRARWGRVQIVSVESTERPKRSRWDKERRFLVRLRLTDGNNVTLLRPRNEVVATWVARKLRLGLGLP